MHEEEKGKTTKKKEREKKILPPTLNEKFHYSCIFFLKKFIRKTRLVRFAEFQFAVRAGGSHQLRKVGFLPKKAMRNRIWEIAGQGKSQAQRGC